MSTKEQATADMLAMPHRVCRQRGCRRRKACSWDCTASGEPPCLRNWKVGERRAFDELYADAAHVRENWRSLIPHPADATRRDLRDGAVSIVRSVIPRSEWRRFASWLRDRDARAFPAGPAGARHMEAFDHFLISQRSR
jgi:hypothetical protein